MRYKDKYPIFITYWKQKTNGHSDILVCKRLEGKIQFLKYFIFILNYRRKSVFGHKNYIKSWYLTFHDAFIGTRIL